MTMWVCSEGQHKIWTQERKKRYIYFHLGISYTKIQVGKRNANQTHIKLYIFVLLIPIYHLWPQGNIQLLLRFNYMDLRKLLLKQNVHLFSALLIQWSWYWFSVLLWVCYEWFASLCTIPYETWKEIKPNIKAPHNSLQNLNVATKWGVLGFFFLFYGQKKGERREGEKGWA